MTLIGFTTYTNLECFSAYTIYGGGEDMELFIMDSPDQPYLEHGQHDADNEKLANEALEFFQQYMEDDDNF
jgi:hypothetical protein